MAKINNQINSDASQSIVIGASQGVFNQIGQAGGDILQQSVSQRIVVDQEVANLLDWLASEQGITPEVALKKAVATAAYIHDVTANQGGKLLVKRKDNSVGEIVLN